MVRHHLRHKFNQNQNYNIMKTISSNYVKTVKQQIAELEGKYSVISVCHQEDGKYVEDCIDIDEVPDAVLNSTTATVGIYTKEEYISEFFNDSTTLADIEGWVGDGDILVVEIGHSASVEEAMSNYHLDTMWIDHEEYLVGFESFEDVKSAAEDVEGDACLIQRSVRGGVTTSLVDSPVYDKVDEYLEDDNYLRVYWNGNGESAIIDDFKEDIKNVIEECDDDSLLDRIQKIKDVYEALLARFALLDDDEVLFVGDTLDKSCIDIEKRFPVEWNTTLYHNKYAVRIPKR